MHLLRVAALVFFSLALFAPQARAGAYGDNDIPDRYSYVDPDHLVPRDLLAQALAAFDERQDSLGNANFLSVIDFGRHASKARFFVIDMKSGQVEAIHVAHGKGSDPKATGYAKRFSNVINSEMSSLGVYQTAETYDGDHGPSLRLDGLSETNSNVRVRNIVLHEARYVSETGKTTGRSDGCFAVAPEVRDHLIDEIGNGSLIYADVAGQ